ncbi:MAG: amino acid ABC transporter ATP-binding protein [Puniceicoccales bacterium]|jgi:polar amino acid transport system ATP-binding protein|nr:amino acid ABC transporter ATP-binding protein [Puniceicoccales bacterium]
MLEVSDMHCKIGAHEILADVSFSVSTGEVAAIIGGSGAGKTTIIRALCGLQKISNGRISIDSHEPKRGDYGLVPQGCCLFEHMTALQNVSYAPMAVLKFSRKKAGEVARKMLAKFGLEGKMAAYPSGLSGGQKQRVAIARTLVMNPKVLLFDEPTSALDPEMTSDVIATISDIAANGMPTLLVTHDLATARKVSHRIFFLEHGKIIENRKTAEFFSNPHTERAKSFLKNSAYID